MSYYFDGNILQVTSVTTTVSNGSLQLNLDGSFTYTPTPGFSGADGFTYIVNDGSVDSGPVSVNITVNHVNHAPLAGADAFNLPQDSVLSVPAAGLLANDLDIDGDSLFVLIQSFPVQGALHQDLDGGFTYSPAPGYQGTDSYTYMASDGKANSGVVTVSLNVNSVNHTPLAGPDSYSTSRNNVLQVNTAQGLLNNDTDIDGDNLTAVITSQPQHGALHALSDGSFSYTPAVDYAGLDAFSYKASDGDLESAPVNVTINVNFTNRAPVAHDDAYSVPQDTLLSVPARQGLLANDTDADGDQLSVLVTSHPAHGKLHINADGSFTYQARAGYSGSDSYTYTAKDGQERSNLATVNISISAVNRAPQAMDDDYSMNSDTTLQVDEVHGVLVNDTDLDGNQITAILVSSPSHGILHLQNDGSFTYTLSDPNYGGTDTFTYKAQDGHLESSEASVDIDVHKVNQVPVANDDSYVVDKNTTLTVTPNGERVLLNDTDANGDLLTASVDTGPSNGTLHLLTDGSFTYTPNSNFVGLDSFTYKAFDGLAYSSAANVTIDVKPTFMLRVDLTGQGRVTGGLSSRTTTSSIDCPGNCEAVFPAGSFAALTAQSSTYVTSGSWSWSGVCPDSQSSCNYEMDADKVARVTFSCELISVPSETVSTLEADWVCNNLEALSGYEIKSPDGEITFRAQDSIRLGPGFKVELGGVFHAIMYY